MGCSAPKQKTATFILLFIYFNAQLPRHMSPTLAKVYCTCKNSSRIIHHSLADQEVEPMVGWKNRMLQWGRKMMWTRPRLTILAIICVCVMVVLVAVLFSLPRLEEETGTSVRLPEDGIISATFSYRGNYCIIMMITQNFHKLSHICT